MHNNTIHLEVVYGLEIFYHMVCMVCVGDWLCGCVDGNVKLMIIVATGLLTGCAAYTVTNAAAWIATGKSITDHSSSAVTGADCDSVRAVKELTYWCDTVPDIHTRYNRNGI